LSNVLDLAILGLASWRLAHLLVHERGPFHLFERLRRPPLVNEAETGMLNCLYCTSVWIALGLYALWQIIQWPVVLLAISALAILVDHLNES